MSDRLAARFANLRADNRAGFITYVMGGDPDLETTWEVLNGLPGAGADVIELGFPFSDPTADGPSIQAAGQRALKNGVRFDDILTLATRFRAAHPDTPLVVMGYANVLHHRGWEKSADLLANAGIDGAIIVDLPPEEDADLRAALANQGVSLIRLAAPTSDSTRLARIVENASGFLYYVSVAGVTGTSAATDEAVAAGVERIRSHSDLPVAVGFGVRTPEQAAAIGARADAVVVGSAIVEALASGGPETALALTRTLSTAVRTARAPG